MKNYNEKFLNKTIGFWQPLCNRTLTKEDAKKIIFNTSKYLNQLCELNKEEWKRVLNLALEETEDRLRGPL